MYELIKIYKNIIMLFGNSKKNKYIIFLSFFGSILEAFGIGLIVPLSSIIFDDTIVEKYLHFFDNKFNQYNILIVFIFLFLFFYIFKTFYMTFLS